MTTELATFILIVFILNLVLNVLIVSYFRCIIKEEKHLDEVFNAISDYWHTYLKMEGKETDGLE